MDPGLRLSALVLAFACGCGCLAAEPGPITAAALDERRATLHQRLPEHTVLVQTPFVVITDIDDPDRRERAVALVRWTAELLQKDFFPAPPDGIYELWLFKGAESYGRTVRHLTGEAPISPYGFCSHAAKAIYLDYATGGGTLVHELTHAFMQGNFPACPTWFNEGLASLFEAVREHDGHLQGLPNWRLAGLQEALKDGSAPGFATLLAMSAGRFYGEGSRVHYGVARYLCYDLQRRGLLIPYYRALVANQRDDINGIASLMQVLGVTSLMAYRAEWEAATLRLELPAR